MLSISTSEISDFSNSMGNIALIEDDRFVSIIWLGIVDSFNFILRERIEDFSRYTNITEEHNCTCKQSCSNSKVNCSVILWKVEEKKCLLEKEGVSVLFLLCESLQVKIWLLPFLCARGVLFEENFKFFLDKYWLSKWQIRILKRYF